MIFTITFSMRFLLGNLRYGTVRANHRLRVYNYVKNLSSKLARNNMAIVTRSYRYVKYVTSSDKPLLLFEIFAFIRAGVVTLWTPLLLSEFTKVDIGLAPVDVFGGPRVKRIFVILESFAGSDFNIKHSLQTRVGSFAKWITVFDLISMSREF